MKLQGKTILLHGPPKVGKTQLCSKFEKPLFIATEAGHSFIPEEQQKQRVFVGYGQFKKALTFVDKLLTKQEPTIKTIVIDTIAGLYEECFRFICGKKGIEHPSDLAHGRGWDEVKTTFNDLLKGIATFCEVHGITLIFIDHSKETIVETETVETTRVTCAMTGACRNIIMRIPDYIWYLGYDDVKSSSAVYLSGVNNVKRRLYFLGGWAVEAGTRDIQVNTPSMILPKENPVEAIEKELSK